MDEAAALLDAACAHFATGVTRPLPARIAALRALRNGMEAMEGEILAALRSDLGKSDFDSWTSEILLVRQEIALALKRLPRWAGERRAGGRWFHFPGRAALRMEPRGAVLILGPWNYPVQLCLVPLVSAVAAGNAVVLKPSEVAPASAEVLARLVARCFAPGHVAVAQGGPSLAAALTAQPFDHLFFTGSTETGRKVAEAAARNLATTTLELGGANPCVVDADADPVPTARRIAWAKFLNAGQTCLAPNHVLVHESKAEALLDALRATIARFYGEDGRGMQRVVNARHLARLEAVLPRGRAAIGGGVDHNALHIQPTVLLDPDPALLEEEIFGPVLPVATWRDRDALLAGLARRPSPLALYVHTRDAGFAEAVAAALPSGGLCVNEHIVHCTVPDLPFGGVGPSGSGRYHGEAGFEAFSNPRALFRQPAGIDPTLRYPPPRAPLSIIRRLMG
ncbi:aldehyde dehydrogenase family protein [Pararoseomonas sp. SCSIO 73927]|uniref:aldehyde dehydrogenase family protein n=1 Tax=Pararoseomonas sp. SCSIO 73927 TaxID=3114537 RepID=UPI0030CB1B60